MTELRERFEQWRSGEFDDLAAEAITTLSTNALRDLQRWGALRASGGGGRGKRRTWNREALCKGAMTAALQKGGLSLQMAARISFHIWNISTINSCDPMLRITTWEQLNKPVLNQSERVPGEHAVKQWLTNDFAAPRHDDDFDSYLHIVNNAYVISEAAVVPFYRRILNDRGDLDDRPLKELFTLVLGRISEDGSTFYAWQRPRRKKPLKDTELAKLKKANADGVDLIYFVNTFEQELNYIGDQYSDEISLDFLQYKFESEAKTESALNALHHYSVKTSVNVTLAMRMAMRRAMQLPLAEL